MSIEFHTFDTGRCSLTDRISKPGATARRIAANRRNAKRSTSSWHWRIGTRREYR